MTKRRRRVREKWRGAARDRKRRGGKKTKTKGKRRRMTTSLMRVERSEDGEREFDEKDGESEDGRPPSNRERATETERMRENAREIQDRHGISFRLQRILRWKFCLFYSPSLVILRIQNSHCTIFRNEMYNLTTEFSIYSFKRQSHPPRCRLHSDSNY